MTQWTIRSTGASKARRQRCAVLTSVRLADDVASDPDAAVKDRAK
jgi:hypothetical protein